MKDRIPGAPGKYSAVVAGGEYEKLQTGQPFSITLKRDDEPVEVGTPYSKAAVLPDSLAKKLCPDKEDPTPADAFSALANNRVVSQGESNGWLYRQWANGMAECWITIKNIEDNGFGVGQVLPFGFKRDAGVKMIASFSSNEETQIPILKYYMLDTLGGDDIAFGLYYHIAVFDTYTGNFVDNYTNITMDVYVVGAWKDIINSGGGSYSDVTAKIEDDVLIIE